MAWRKAGGTAAIREGVAREAGRRKYATRERSSREGKKKDVKIESAMRQRGYKGGWYVNGGLVRRFFRGAGCAGAALVSPLPHEPAALWDARFFQPQEER